MLSVLVLSVAVNVCGGDHHDRQGMKVSSAIEAPTAVSLDELLATPAPPQPAKADHLAGGRFFDAPIPGQYGRLHEGQVIAVDGWLHLVARERDDCDFHVQISANRDDGSDCVIVEVPEPTLAPTAELAERFRKVRVDLERLSDGVHGRDLDQPKYVRVIGQLFFDTAHAGGHDPGGGRGKDGMKAGTLWEIHPILEVRLLDPPAPVARGGHLTDDVARAAIAEAGYAFRALRAHGAISDVDQHVIVRRALNAAAITAKRRKIVLEREDYRRLSRSVSARIAQFE